MDRFSFIISLALLALALSSCVTTEEGSSSKAHLGMESHFNAADGDKNGKLSIDEVASFHHDELLALYDLDGDQHLSAAEWNSAHPTAAESDPRFNQIDRNGDKKLSEEEALTWVTEHVSFGDAFAKYDADGDFHLHWKELDEGAPFELRMTVLSLPFG